MKVKKCEQGEQAKAAAMAMEDRYLNVSEVAAFMGVSRDFVYKKIREREFPFGVHFGSAHRWTLSEIKAWAAAQAGTEA